MPAWFLHADLYGRAAGQQPDLYSRVRRFWRGWNRHVLGDGYGIRQDFVAAKERGWTVGGRAVRNLSLRSEPFGTADFRYYAECVHRIAACGWGHGHRIFPRRIRGLRRN